MLLHLYKVPEALFITVTVVTVLFALNKVNAGRTGRVIMLVGIGLGLVLAVIRTVSHEVPKVFCQWFFPGKTDIPDNDINLTLWYIGLGILIPLIILIAAFFRKNAARAGKTAAAVFSALLSADLIAYKAWTVLWAPLHFETGDNGILSDVFLLRLAGWLIALTVLTVYIRFLYKCCMRLHEDPVIWNRTGGRPGCSGWWVLRLTACLMAFTLTVIFYGLVLQSWTRVRSLRPGWLPELLPQLKLEYFLKFTVGNNTRAGGDLIPAVKWASNADHSKGFALDNGVLFLLLFAVMALIPAAVLFFRSLRLRGLWKNTAQKRRLRSDNRHNRRWAVITLILAAVILFCLSWVYNEDNKPPEVPDAEEYSIVYTDENGAEHVIAPADVEKYDAARIEVRVPVNQVNDYNLHAFEMRRSMKDKVRWIVILKPGSSAYGVGLDACDVCGSAGYYQRDDKVVCKKCDVVMNISTIGLAGGCNPVPLEFRVDGGSIVIPMEALLQGERRFR